MRGNPLKLTLIYFCTRFHLYLHAYALLLQSRGLSLPQISAIESVVIGMIFLAEVPTGVLADRIGRKASVVASLFFLFCGEALFLISRSYPAYLIMAIFTGVGFAFGSGAIEALMHDSLPAEDRERGMLRAMGRYHAVGQIAFFLSPIAGAWLLADLTAERFNLAIGLTALMIVIGLGIALTLREPGSEWHAQRSSPLTILRAGWGQVRGQPALRRMVLLAVLTTPLNGALITTFAGPHLRANAVSPALIGLALSIGSLLAAGVQAAAPWIGRRLGLQRALLALTLLPGVSYLALAIAAGPAAAWGMIVWLYATNDARAPILSAWQNAHIESGSRATTLSLINMVMALYMAVAAPVYALIGARSLPAAFALLGAVILVMAAGIGVRPDPLPASSEIGTPTQPPPKSREEIVK